METPFALINGNSFVKIVLLQGVPAALLIFLVILGATVFAKDLAEVKSIVVNEQILLNDLHKSLELSIKIQRQACVNTANGDRLAIAGCMVTE